MKAKIEVTFDREDSNERGGSDWNWNYGIVKIQEISFDFSLLEMRTLVGGQMTTVTEITWVEETPENHLGIEAFIERAFQKEFV
jgi:hypothetical protein